MTTKEIFIGSVLQSGTFGYEVTGLDELDDDITVVELKNVDTGQTFLCKLDAVRNLCFGVSEVK